MACRPTKKACFKCGLWFDEKDAKYCHECTEWKCAVCGACGCDVSQEVLFAVRAIVKTYEQWMMDDDDFRSLMLKRNN
jgi:hypothetical protein